MFIKYYYHCILSVSCLQSKFLKIIIAISWIVHYLWSDLGPIHSCHYVSDTES